MNFQTNKVFFTTMECKSHYHIGPEKLVVSHLIQSYLWVLTKNPLEDGEFQFVCICSLLSNAHNGALAHMPT